MTGRTAMDSPSSQSASGDDPRSFDLVVIGSGGAAMAGAIKARDLGRSVLVVEQKTVGGTCVNVGCIPSKSLLVTSERREIALAQAVEVKAALVEGLRRSKYLDLLSSYGVALRTGTARLLDVHTVEVDGDPVSAGAILIASGARPAVPGIPGLEDSGYLTSTTAMELTDAPGRLAVIGANAVGLELGQMLGNFGSHVTFISRRAVAPNSEPEISGAIRDVLTDAGHEILEDAETETIDREGDRKILRGRVGGTEEFEIAVDEVLVATGRIPNTESLGLAEIGVVTDERGRIAVDERQGTNLSSVYAAGDVATQPQYVYVAAAGGAAAAENALTGTDERVDLSALPRIIFTKPQIAQAGLTEAQALGAGFVVETSVLPLEAVPRALVNGDTRGLVKLVAEAGTRRLIGASILADGGSDAIHAAVIAIERALTVEELARTWAPYLTMSEGLRLAAQTFERDVTRLSCCAA